MYNSAHPLPKDTLCVIPLHIIEIVNKIIANRHFYLQP